MKYILKNEEEVFEYNININYLNEKTFWFIDPIDKATKVTLEIVNKKHIIFKRQGMANMEVNLQPNAILEGIYQYQGFDFKIHTKCSKLYIDEKEISFEYLLYIDYKKENKISISFVK